MLDQNFAAPEVILALACFKNGLSLIPYDPIKSDTFSLGLVQNSILTLQQNIDFEIEKTENIKMIKILTAMLNVYYEDRAK